MRTGQLLAIERLLREIDEKESNIWLLEQEIQIEKQNLDYLRKVLIETENLKEDEV